jgi:hypothetical protein
VVQLDADLYVTTGSDEEFEGFPRAVTTSSTALALLDQDMYVANI